MKNTSATLVLTTSIFLGACSVAVPRSDFDRHAMTVSGDGDIRAPSGNAQQAENQTDYFSKLPPERFAEYVDRIFKAAEDKKAKRILIFVHGGLNSLKNSTKRVSDLIGKYDNKEMPYYPIFINWDSGLWESYTDHLYSIRQGETAYTTGISSSPFYLIADIGRTIIRAPIAIGYTVDSDVNALPSGSLSGEDKKYISSQRENAKLIYQCLLQRHSDSISLGREHDWEHSWRLYAKSIWNIVTYPFQLLTAPPIDGFGHPAWESMQRRAKVLFNKPEQFDIEGDPLKAPAALDGRPVGAMTVFMSRLQRHLQDRPKSDKIEVTVVAHSMGTFIVNQMVRAYPELHYKTIIYMAGADSIRNTFNSVLPYLNRPDHEETNFVNLTLHPQAEVEEMSGYGLLPRGSLLVWVDNLFSTPHTHYDRTVGRWDNLLPTLGEIPTRLKSRVKIKAFDQDSKIATHGDFTENDFWREEFWRPGKPDCNPWPSGNEASCPKPSLSQATQCK